MEKIKFPKGYLNSPSFVEHAVQPPPSEKPTEPRVVQTQFPSDPLLTDSAAFGAAVRAARTRAGMTLADAALNVGVAKQTLADLETGKGSVGLATALMIARELGVSIFAIPAAEREPARRLLMDLGSRYADVAASGKTMGDE